MSELARLAPLSLADLRDEWERIHKAPPPRLSADLLRLGLAYRVQETAMGKRANRVRDLSTAGRRPRRAPKLGTRFVRSWNGRTIHVVTTEDGYVFEDRLYPSLSAIARAVTGAHWSGPRFFGVTDHG